MTPNHASGAGGKALQAGIVQPAVDGLESMEMEEDQLIVINADTSAEEADLVVGEVPRGEVGAFVGQRGDALEQRRPLVEVFLVGVAAWLDPVITPFQAARAPPVQASARDLIPAEGDPADVIDAGLLKLPQGRREPMGDNGNGARPISANTGSGSRKK